MQHKPDHPSPHIYWFHQRTLMDLWNMTSFYKNNVVSSPVYLSRRLSILFITVFYHFVQDKSQTCWSVVSQVSPRPLLKEKKSLLWLYISYLPFFTTTAEFISVLWKTLSAEFWLLWQDNASVLWYRRNNRAIRALSQLFMTSLAQTEFFF